MNDLQIYSFTYLHYTWYNVDKVIYSFKNRKNYLVKHLIYEKKQFILLKQLIIDNMYTYEYEKIIIEFNGFGLFDGNVYGIEDYKSIIEKKS